MSTTRAMSSPNPASLIDRIRDLTGELLQELYGVDPMLASFALDMREEPMCNAQRGRWVRLPNGQLDIFHCQTITLRILSGEVIRHFREGRRYLAARPSIKGR